MSTNLNKYSILPKMRLPEQKENTFQLIWNLDLNISPTRCLINLLFKNVNTGYYLIDSIPPELLSYCTIGSHFKNGIRTNKIKAVGDILTIHINSSDRNNITQVNNVLSDSEYDLSLKMHFDNYFLDRQSSICKRQLCLSCYDNTLRVIFPCAVIAGVYYFRSTSLREAIFKKNLRVLYESFSPPDDIRHAKILLKPGAADDDAKIISRFLSSELALKRSQMIFNHANISKSQQVLMADFPVNQELTIKARGHLTSDSQGNKTFIVFQILEEDSAFPFDSLDKCRWEHESCSTNEESKSYPVNQANPSNNLTTANPDSGYIQKLLKKHVSIINSNEKAIRETAFKLRKTVAPDTASQMIIHSDKDIDLSTQLAFPVSPVESSVAKANVEQHEEIEAKDGYEMPLSEFEQMVATLDRCKHVDRDGVSREVTNFSISRQTVWQREKTPRMRLSLREVYNLETKKQRECAYVRFNYGHKNVSLVEIDHTDLPNKCSTYVIISHEPIEDNILRTVVKYYVEGKKPPEMCSSLAQQGIILERKQHPRSSSDKHMEAWRNRLFAIINGA